MLTTDEQSAVLTTSSKNTVKGEEQKPRRAKSLQNTRQRKNTRVEDLSFQNIRTKYKADSFGVRVTLLRVLLGLTKESFADMLLATRQSVAAIEKCERVDEVSDGMIFRIYYFAKEVTENPTLSREVNTSAKRILKEVRTYIIDRNN